MSDIEREEFEQAVANKWSDSYKFTRFGDEDYYDEVLEGMWWGWQASRQALEGEPVAWWDGDTSAAEDSFSFKLNRCYTIPLYTHPASAEVERLHARMAEKCDAPVGWIDPEKYKAACESKMKFFKTIKELREQNEKLQARVAELESDEQEMAGDNNV